MGSAPKAPDYTPIMRAQMAMAQEQSAVSREQLAWAKETWTADRQFMTEIFDIQKPIMLAEAANAITNADNRQKLLDIQVQMSERENQAAAENRQRYKDVFQPLEDQLVKDAQNADSPEKIAELRGRAMADVGDQYDAARRNAAQRLEGYGIDPGQTRAGALDTGIRLQEASAKAAASEGSRLTAENRALALRGEAINIGKGYPGQIAQANATALGAGNAAGGAMSNAGKTAYGMGQGMNAATNASSASGSNMMGSPTQWGASASGNYSNAANTMTQQYNANMSEYNANNAMWGGIGGAVGSLAGFGMGFFNEGGAIPADPQDPAGRKDRFAIAVAGDEFVVPASVTRRLGSQFFDKLVAKHGDARDQQAANERLQTGKPGGQRGKPSAQAGAIPLGME